MYEGGHRKKGVCVCACVCVFYGWVDRNICLQRGFLQKKMVVSVAVFAVVAVGLMEKRTLTDEELTEVFLLSESLGLTPAQ